MTFDEFCKSAQVGQTETLIVWGLKNTLTLVHRDEDGVILASDNSVTRYSTLGEPVSAICGTADPEEMLKSERGWRGLCRGIATAGKYDVH
jgi:hypothetical protein